MTLILASSSPRRRDILTAAGFEFDLIAPEVEETADVANGIRAMCEENALLKAAEVFEKNTGAVVIGSDTLVFVDGEPLGKPHTPENAVMMLKRLSGRTCTVCSGVAVLGPQGQKTFSETVDVEFLRFGPTVITDYMNKVNVLDKAGAFAAQQEAQLIILEIRGDIETVMGLPIQELKRVLAEFGLQPRD